MIAWRGDGPAEEPLALSEGVRGALAGGAVLQRAQAPTFALDQLADLARRSLLPDALRTGVKSL